MKYNIRSRSLTGIVCSVIFETPLKKKRRKQKRVFHRLRHRLSFMRSLRLFLLKAGINLFCSRRNSLNICFCLTKCCPHFLRNDNNPVLAALSVLFCGIFNISGDYFFVFVCSTSIYSAGLAATIVSLISLSLCLPAF